MEGAFVMSLGLFLTEELKFDPVTGKLLTADTWVGYLSIHLHVWNYVEMRVSKLTLLCCRRILPENTNFMGSITVWLTYCIFCLDSAALLEPNDLLKLFGDRNTSRRPDKTFPRTSEWLSLTTKSAQVLNSISRCVLGREVLFWSGVDVIKLFLKEILISQN